MFKQSDEPIQEFREIGTLLKALEKYPNLDLKCKIFLSGILLVKYI